MEPAFDNQKFDSSAISEEKKLFCNAATSIVTHWSYRSMQLLHIFLCITSMFLLFQVIMYTARKLLAHSNIKTLLLLLYIACFLHAALVAAFQTHHLFTSFTYSNPCDVIIPRWVYCIYHVPFSASVMWIENIQILMYIERAIATYYVKYYEYSAKWMGKYYILASLILPIFGEFWMNYNSDWLNEWHISALNTPKANAFRMNILMGSLTLLNVLLVASTVLMNRANRRTEKNVSGNGFSLSLRYQANENFASTRFLAIITTGQLFLFAIYGTATMVVRFNCDTLNSNSILYRTIILMAYTVPIYTLLLPWYSLRIMERNLTKRRASINALIDINFVGQEGWENYLSFIIHQCIMFFGGLKHELKILIADDAGGVAVYTLFPRWCLALLLLTISSRANHWLIAAEGIVFLL